jgi:hypothetical protein
VKQLAVNEASLQALRTKQREAQQHFSEALERERLKYERKLAVESDQLVSDNKKTLRKMDIEWEKICNGLKKQLGAQQTQVVHLELMRARVERAGKEREEGLLRKDCTMRVETTVSSLFRVIVMLYLFYFMI